jgi:hypothetical protein
MRFGFAALLAMSLGATSSMASDVRFTSGHSALKIPFRLFNNHIYLHVSVNGSAPLWLVLDTGAPNIIASKHARALRLKVIPAGRSDGVGENLVEAFRARDVAFALPGIAVTGQTFGVLPWEEIEECANKVDIDSLGNITPRTQSSTGDQRQPFDGVLGDEFFKLFVVEIDYAAQLIDLYEPRSYRYAGRGEAIPLEVRQQKIFVRAPIKSSISGNVTGTFMIDTGSAGAVSLNRPFIEKHGIMPPDAETTPFDVCGIGGTSRSRIGTLESLGLTRAGIKAPVTIFSQAREGTAASTDWDGLIGNAILRRFKVVFDHSRSRMYLETPAKNMS